MSNPNDNILTGQVAIVTGGGRGIGRATAQALAAAGASVAVVARSTNQLAETVALIEASGGRAIAFTADVTQREAIEQMAHEVEQQLGSVDLLVNNAGIVSPLGPFWEIDPDEWWRSMEINLRSMLLCTRAVLPSMIARHRGRIINLTSGAGLAPILYGSAYCTSKASVIRFTDALAIETKGYGISVFAVHPGNIRTTMAEYLMESAAGQKWTPGFRKIFDEGRDTPMESAIQLMLSLVSGKADALSGRYIAVTYDLDELMRRAEEIQKNDLYTLRLRM
jgi:NAD(P)-dependent dehydrogenase (short-subunit alcohol dehydrogenase family)